MSFIRRVKVKGHTYFQECESYRENGKIKTRVLKHLGKNPCQVPSDVEMGELREDRERLEAEIKRLKAQNEAMERQLKQHSLSSFPLTYEGALDYIAAIASEHLYPQPEVVASELNRLGFPGFRGGKWDKQKVKRQLDKLRGKIKTVEVKAQAIA